MSVLKLFMVLVGCRPKGRNTEQHDVLFGIASSIKELVPTIINFWPEVKGNIHVDAWREVTEVDNFKIEILPKANNSVENTNNKLFFLNLGGYKKNEFEEFHYKMLAIATSKKEAVKIARETAFYKHTGFKGAPSHIDDKYGVDVDEVFEIKDIVPTGMKAEYSINIAGHTSEKQDEMHLGYFKL
ncbi:MAG TPA: DUF1543 domain-containing protein, partial [Segetibacter sp.]